MCESKERLPTLNCFKCGRSGHKAADCWGVKGSHGGYESASNAVSGANVDVNVRSGSSGKIICYTCGVEGHKSPQCPKKPDGISKDVKLKPVKRVRQKQDKCARLNGQVNGHSVPVVMDSGASVSIVPENLVSSENMLGERIAVQGVFRAEEIPLAIVPFRIGEWEWEEEVAVAPLREDGANEVIFGLDLEGDS